MNIAKLPFVAHTSDGRLSLWNPDRSGSYDDQWQRGKEYAHKLAEYIQQNESVMLLMQIIRQMDTAKMFEPVEGGFLTIVSTTFAAYQA